MSTTYLLDDLCQVYLPAQIGSLTFGTTLFAGLVPDGTGVADNLVAVNEYPGESPIYVMGSANPLPAITIPHIQVVSRNTSYVNARSKCEDVVRALEKVCNQTINTTYYERIERLQDPFPMHRDVNRRTHFACNLRVHRTPS